MLAGSSASLRRLVARLHLIQCSAMPCSIFSSASDTDNHSGSVDDRRFACSETVSSTEKGGRVVYNDCAVTRIIRLFFPESHSVTVSLRMIRKTFRIARAVLAASVVVVAPPVVSPGTSGSSGAGPDCSGWLTEAFWQAVAAEDVERCLAAGAKIDARDWEDRSPLHYAARGGIISVTRRPTLP